jgi:hypothetical protein
MIFFSEQNIGVSYETNCIQFSKYCIACSISAIIQNEEVKEIENWHDRERKCHKRALTTHSDMSIKTAVDILYPFKPEVHLNIKKLSFHTLQKTCCFCYKDKPVNSL